MSHDQNTNDDSKMESAEQVAPDPPTTPTPASPPRWRLHLALLLTILILAAGIRVTYVLQSRSSPLFSYPIMDAAYHDEWARAIAAGETFIEGPYFRAPLYPWFLGTVYTLFGHDYLIPRLIQAGIGAVSCVLLFLIGRDTLGRPVGFIAGLAAATYWMFVYYDAELLLVPLVVVLDLLLLWLSVRAMHRPTPTRWTLAGVALGLATITRPNALVFLPVALMCILACKARRPLVLATLFILGTLAPILPITARNYFVGNDVVLVSSQGGVNFFIGNNAESDGVTAIVPGTPGDWWGGYHATIKRAEQAKGRELKPSEVSQYYFDQAFEFWRRAPGLGIALTLHKFRLFWTPRELGNNVQPAFFAREFASITHYLPLRFHFIAPLAVVGFVLRRRDWRILLPVLGFGCLYTLGVVAFFVNARFRMPVVPVLILLAAASIWWLIQRGCDGQWRTVMLTIGGTAALGIAIAWLAAPRAGMTDAQSLQVLADAYYDTGNYAKSVDFARRWQSIEPRQPRACVRLAKALREVGDEPAGRTVLEQFQRGHPAEPRTLVALTEMMTAAGQQSEAIALLRSLHAQHPRDTGIGCLLAWHLATAKRDELRHGNEALTLARRAERASGGRVADVLKVLAAAHAELGQYQQAEDAATRALDLAREDYKVGLAAELEHQLRKYRTDRPHRE